MQVVWMKKLIFAKILITEQETNFESSINLFLFVKK